MTKGIRWSCWDCMPKDIDFYKLFKEAKCVIPELKKILKTMNKNICEFKDLFENKGIFGGERYRRDHK